MTIWYWLGLILFIAFILFIVYWCYRYEKLGSIDPEYEKFLDSFEPGEEYKKYEKDRRELKERGIK